MLKPKPIVALLLPPEIAGSMFTAADLKRLRAVARLTGPVPQSDSAAHRRILRRAVAALTGWWSPPLDESLLAAAPGLRLIAHTGGTVRGLVTPAVFARGIRVTNAASANARPVAEYTVAMMVAMLKQIPWLTMAMARGDAAETAARRALCREMQDMTIGLIGASRVGREVIRLLRSYSGLTIKVYDPYLSAADARALGVKRVSLAEACACEIVSVHAPNIPETRHMMNAATLSRLPDHAIFINTARGALVDEAALLAEVRRRPIYALLDVTDPEPVPADSPLRREPNILLTPHVAGAMSQARHDMGRLAIGDVMRFLAGKKLVHEVKAEGLAVQA